MQSLITPWLMPIHPHGQLPLVLFRDLLFLFVQNTSRATLFHRLLKCLCGNQSNHSKCDTKVCCFLGLDIKQRRSCREQLPGTRGGWGVPPARLTWACLWGEGTGRRMPRSWRSQFGQSLPTCTDQRLQHHGNKGSLSLNCHFTRSQQQGINPEYFCSIKSKQTLSKPLHSLSCQRHFINVLQKHTK